MERIAKVFQHFKYGFLTPRKAVAEISKVLDFQYRAAEVLEGILAQNGLGLVFEVYGTFCDVCGDSTVAVDFHNPQDPAISGSICLRCGFELRQE